MASGRDMSYNSVEMGDNNQQGSFIPPATGYQGRDMTYNNSGEYTNQAQQMRHDEFIDQVSTFPGQNDPEFLQQIKTEEYLNQRNHSGQDNSILQQTGEGVKHAAEGAFHGAANMAHGAAASAANIAQGAASAVKNTLGMDTRSNDSPNSATNANYGSGTGTNYGSGTGTNYGSGTGTNYGSGTGTNYGSGIGTNYGSGTGTNYGSGTGTNYGLGTGTGVGTGTNYTSNYGKRND